jgi:hypothetical protein
VPNHRYKTQIRLLLPACAARRCVSWLLQPHHNAGQPATKMALAHMRSICQGCLALHSASATRQQLLLLAGSHQAQRPIRQSVRPPELQQLVAGTGAFPASTSPTGSPSNAPHWQHSSRLVARSGPGVGDTSSDAREGIVTPGVCCCWHPCCTACSCGCSCRNGCTAAPAVQDVACSWLLHAPAQSASAASTPPA